jgi:hypothetical protein
VTKTKFHWDTARGYYRRSGPGGLSAGRSARSMMMQDKGLPWAWPHCVAKEATLLSHGRQRLAGVAARQGLARHGKDYSCGRASQRCQEFALHDILGSSIVAVPLCPIAIPWKASRDDTRSKSSLEGSALAIAFWLGKALPGTRQGPSIQREGGRKASPLGGEGSLLRKDPRHSGTRRLTEEGTSPCQEGEAYTRRIGMSLESQSSQAHGECILSRDLLYPPGMRMEDAQRKSSTTDLQRASLPWKAW